MRLTKHHGLGNDFLVLLDPDASHPLDADLARALCDRHTGIGADGLIRAIPGGVGRRRAVPDGAAQRRRLPGRDERQRHPVPGPGAAARRPGAGPAMRPSPPTPALRTVTVHEQLDAVTHSLSVAMGAAHVDGRGARVGRRRRGPGAARRHGQPPPRARPVGCAGQAPREDIDLVELGETVNGKVPGGANVHLLTAGADQAASPSAPTSAASVPRWPAAPAPARRPPPPGRGAWPATGSPVAQPGGTAEVTLGAAPADEVVLRGPATYVGEIDAGGVAVALIERAFREKIVLVGRDHPARDGRGHRAIGRRAGPAGRHGRAPTRSAASTSAASRPTRPPTSARARPRSCASWRWPPTATRSCSTTSSRPPSSSTSRSCSAARPSTAPR